MADRGDVAWARTLPARATREALLCGVLAPILRAYARPHVSGREHLTALDGPAILVANHCSHVDTPLLLRSLPGPVRRRTAVAAAADYFYKRKVLGAVVSLAFCTVPIRRHGLATNAGLAPLLAGGWNLVIFAEGTRSRDGSVGALRPGAAALAAEHGLPIVPVHIAGTHVVMPTGRRWLAGLPGPGRKPLQVSFGPPIAVDPQDDRLAVMDEVREFMASCGAQTTPDPKLGTRREAAPADLSS